METWLLVCLLLISEHWDQVLSLVLFNLLFPILQCWLEDLDLDYNSDSLTDVLYLEVSTFLFEMYAMPHLPNRDGSIALSRIKQSTYIFITFLGFSHALLLQIISSWCFTGWEWEPRLSGLLVLGVVSIVKLKGWALSSLPLQSASLS